MSILEKIHGHADLLRLSDEERECLCGEIREFLVNSVSKTGGHLASNLGIVELSVAIETVFDTATDRLVFDVGHQSYVHKLLTGRREAFSGLRQFGGMAGFPKPSESDTDAFVAGHASSSVSIALGMAKARTLSGDNYDVLALIGDGAVTGGLAYEGLNNAAVSKEPLIVILNDNAMSIDQNVGGIARHLSRIRTGNGYLTFKRKAKNFTDRIPGGEVLFRGMQRTKNWIKRRLVPITMFENMGFTYLGPVDGSDVNELITLLKNAKSMKRPVLLHIMTHKGKGYRPAEENPSLFHGIGKFNPETGEPISRGNETFSDVFGQKMLELASTEPRLCAITAAMPGGTGLLEFKSRYPERTFDVGIAEEHAVSMAGGLAKQGMIPVVAIYSTFLQRSYDMILQDVAMLGLHAVFAIDRAGLVGEDGETHHGIFDVGFLRQIPGMTLLCPACTEELACMLEWAVTEKNGPVAIRYPRGGNRLEIPGLWDARNPVMCHRHGPDLTLLTYGPLLKNVMDAAAILSRNGVEATVLRLTEVAPLPIRELETQLSQSRWVVVVEEVCGGCGIREALAWELQHKVPGCRVDGFDLGPRFITHGSLETLYTDCGLDAQSISDYVLERMKA